MSAKKTRDYCAIAADYTARVLDGSQLACKWVKLACQRQRDDLKRWKEDGPFVWDPEAASRVCRFIELLTHTKGELAGQRNQARAVAGVHPDDGIRLEAQRGRRPEVSARLH